MLRNLRICLQLAEITRGRQPQDANWSLRRSPRDASRSGDPIPSTLAIFIRTYSSAQVCSPAARLLVAVSIHPSDLGH